MKIIIVFKITLLVIATCQASLICQASNHTWDSILNDAKSYLNNGDISNGMKTLDKLSELYGDLKTDEYVEYAEALNTAGGISFEHGYPSEAMEFFMLGKSISEKSGDSLLTAKCMGNMASVYGYFRDYGSAAYYLGKSIEVIEKSTEQSTLKLFLSNLVATLCLMDDGENAKYYLEKEKKLLDKNIPQEHFMILKDQTLVALVNSECLKALEYATDMLEVARSANLGVEYEITSLGFLADCQSKCTTLSEAIPYLLEGYKLAQENGIVNQIETMARNLTFAYSEKGDYTNAAHFEAIVRGNTDQHIDEDNFNILKSKFLDMEYQTFIENTERLNQENLMKTIFIILLVIILVLLGVLVFFLIRHSRKMRKKYQLLFEKNERLLRIEDENLKHNDDVKNVIIEETPPFNYLTHDTIRAGDNNLIETNNDFHESSSNPNIVPNDSLEDRVRSILINPANYTTPSFSLEQLSRMAGSNTSYVSAVINKSMGMNFKSYLNSLRVKHACRLIHETVAEGIKPQFSLMAEESGFQSYSNFYSVFSKEVGMSPTIYHKYCVSKKNSTVS